MRRLFKYTWRLLALLLVVVLVIYFIILHTQFGARWTINFFTKQSSLQVEKIEGTLANQIKLTGISYDDGKMVINANQLNYQIKDIQWFSKKLIFEQIGLQNIEVQLLHTSNGKSSSTTFEGFTMPIEIEAQLITINDITIVSDQSTHLIEKIDMSVHIKDKDVKISELLIQNQNASANAVLALQLKPNLPFNIDTNWHFFDVDKNITGKGSISGDIHKIELNNNINSDKEPLIGKVKVVASLELRQDDPHIDATVSSDELFYNFSNQPPITIQTHTSTLIGPLDNYKLTSNLNFFNDEIEQTELSVIGQGSLNDIDFETLSLKNSLGTINLPSTLNWNNEFTAVSQLEFIQFNPTAYLPQWPGLVNGTASLTSIIDEDGDYSLSVKKARFEGKLKQKDLLIIGNAEIKPDDILIDAGQLIIGDNKVDLQAIIKNQNIKADIKTELNDLSILNKNSNGKINSHFKLNGDINNPKIFGQAKVKDLKYQGYQIDSLDIDINGDWLNHIVINSIAQGVDSKNKSFNTINLNLIGNKNKHDINLSIEDEAISSELTANGSFNEASNEWIGHVLHNNIVLKDIQSTWNLKEPIKIEYKKDIDLSKACWINQDNSGDICLDFAISSQNNNHQINLELNKLNARFLKLFLPNDLLINGNLDGNAKAHLYEDNVSIESNIDFIDGEIHFFKGSKQSYKTKVLKASLSAIQDNQNSKINSIIKLDDGTELDLNFELFKSANDQLELKGNINGMFTNTQYLASLSEEIDEMKGDFNINGTIQGPLNKLKTNLKATQTHGYLILSQSKTKLENLNFDLQKEPDQDIVFKLIGTAGKGEFSSKGQLSLENTSTDVLWQLTADVQGDNMRLLTLPELELDITPKLKIKADNKAAYISGDINIPYAVVNIKQLPESAISSSPDVVIHTENKGEIENLDDYPIKFDVAAHIDDKVKVDVLGLKSDLQGDLRITNTENSIINGYGSLKTIDGKYTVYGQTLDISKGELLFNGPVDNPSLDVIASRKSISGDVTAGVELGGTVNYLQSSLYSDPVLPDLEILSYILSGRGLNEESDTSSQQLAQAAILLGLKKSSPIFSEIQSRLGIDVLTIKEGATANESTVEAGKQFNENLYVGYNQGLFNRIGFWVLRYRINKALRLETTQGENQSVDLIYVRKKK